MYISKIKLTNWKNFKNIEVPLGETVYILGPNASGKSNFLDVFRFLRDVVDTKGGGLQKAVDSRGGMSKIRCFAARKRPEVRIEVELKESFIDEDAVSDWRYVLEFKVETSGHRRILITREEVWKKGEVLLNRPNSEDKRDTERLTQTALEQINANKEFREIVTFFSEVLYLHLVPQLLKFGNQMALKKITSDPFGQGFLEQIAMTSKKTMESRLKRIQEILKTVIHDFKNLEFRRDNVGAPHLEMCYNHWREHGSWQKEDQFSDGTLRLIALLWTLLESNSMILLEEPELSLHKKVIEQIPTLIYKSRQSRKSAGGQILISTHSEDMLGSQGIKGDFLLLKPLENGEGTKISTPSREDNDSIKCGMTPADVLLPQTAETIGIVRDF